MASRISALLVAGISALLIGSATPAHADDAPPAATGGSETKEAGAQYKANMKTWTRIADTFCDLGNGNALDPRKNRAAAEKQFSDTAINGYYDAYRITPMVYKEDPVVVTRPIVMTEQKHWAFPEKSVHTDADDLRLWRYLLCSEEPFKREWAATLKRVQEGLDGKLKSSEESDIMDVYNKKMAKMDKVLKAEQKRQGIEEPQTD
ncbi:hypothetical protein [Nocardia sp. NPDC051570]|uniref:hypothetical protein n=1 Tax=Nocardia sp. NPDC051570 TaxID=3364324 RepID=UPI0037BBB2CC